MARSVWTGSITIGMLNVPVKLISAVKRQSIAFNQVDDRTGSRIRYQKVAEATNEV
ncbi:MAG: Ku protein, partial [Ilumatobacteraceae bacterium]|nr:Ku protein [Ilumatobacteraceae bacterium]